jgi:hypothetical protein
MNNEPVAWMLVDETNGDYMLEKHPSGDYDWIPLYTHPAELTDEEIEDIASKLVGGGKSYNILFARAILRKASEK